MIRKHKIFIYLNNDLLLYREQRYKSLLPLNKENIFENVHLVVVKMKSGTMKVVNMKFFQCKYTLNIHKNRV